MYEMELQQLNLSQHIKKLNIVIKISKRTQISQYLQTFVFSQYLFRKQKQFKAYSCSIISNNRHRRSQMDSPRHLSTHKLKHQLSESLRKQQSLSNRINVLLFEKQKRFKVMQRRLNNAQFEQQNRLHKSRHRQQLGRSFETSKKEQQNNSHIMKKIREELNQSIHNRQSQLHSTKQEWYSEMKRLQIINHKKMVINREKQLAFKKHKTRQVKLMQMNSKQNIRKYWDERVDCIKEEREKDNRKIYKMMEKSLNSISVLAEQEKRIKDELLGSSLMYSNIETQLNSTIEGREIVTWRTSRDQQ